MKRFAAALLAASLMAGTAQAADLIIADEPVVAVADSAYDWSGFYAGVVGGYGSGTTSYVDPTAVVAPVNVGTSGWLLGATAGYNAQWDMFVLGVEGDIAWSNIRGTAATPLGGTITSNLNWVGTIRGRAGVAVDQALLYVTAGLAAGSLTSTADTGATFGSTHTGWTAGAGVELAVTDDVSLKAEYAYTALNTVSDGGVLTGGVLPVNITPSFHAVKVGANFHF